MKILNGNLMLVYYFNHENPKESNFIIKEFMDYVNFESEYNGRQERNEIFLNIGDAIIILMGKKTFLYDYKTNKMQLFNNTKFEHPNGCLINIPFNDTIYCISGRNTIEVEKIKLYRNSLNIINEWETTCPIQEPRSFFSAFVQNGKKIFLMFGYNFQDEKFIDYFSVLDTVEVEQIWTKVIVKCDKIPLMSCCGTMSFSPNNVYIFGGMNNNTERNNIVYRYNSEDNVLDQSEYILKDALNYLEINPRLPPEHLPSLKFVEESDFKAFDFHQLHIQHAFYFGCFDSRNFFHLINLKTFSHDLFYLDISSMNNETNTNQTNSNENNQPSIENINYKKDKKNKSDNSIISLKNQANNVNKISEKSDEDSLDADLNEEHVIKSIKIHK